MSSKILITGGTGSVGQELVRQTIDSYEVYVFSRNEKAQVEMKLKYPSVEYIIGDIRSYDEIFKACWNIDIVFHLAALKHVDICEKQPQEAIKTNVLGTLNVINACGIQGCTLINMSSDKAINPNNVYGMTKCLAEKMVEQDNFLNIRSGNVLWSSGSVLPLWKKQLEDKNSINITSDKMTRFFIHPKELVAFILDSEFRVGTITVPMKSFRLFDIAKEFIRLYGNGSSKINVTGLRLGERLHEFRDENTSSDKDICTDLNYIFQ